LIWNKTRCSQCGRLLYCLLVRDKWVCAQCDKQAR